ncbi:MAG: glucose-6-phosphate isomerase [Pseudomonadota bacterium]
MMDRTAAWEALSREAGRLKTQHLRTLFETDPDRFDRFSCSAEGLLVDFSKEKIDSGALDALLALALSSDLQGQIARLFDGERVNATENRAALHMALRDGVAEGTRIDGEEVLPIVRRERERMLAFAEAVRSGEVCASDGAPFTDVVNLGIGGSDLGPAMALRALRPWQSGPNVHFVSNIDGTSLADTLGPLDPARTLVIVASKSFSTLETMANANSARAWLANVLGDAVGAHCAAVSSNLAATEAFGIAPERVFGFWDWVGGRYSVWSSIGLPLAIAIGAEAFGAFLSGARTVDRHFCEAPLDQNLPVLLGLIAIWRRNAMGNPATALIPYEERLARLPAWLQQLDLESNGKRVTTDGAPVAQATAGIVFGEPGTNAQHSFFQLLHQGADVVPVDFLVGARVSGGTAGHHAPLFASALAQASALAFGRTEGEVRAEMQSRGVAGAEIDRLAPHRTFPGDRPSTTILYEELTPHVLGQLLALFEHRTFVCGAIWGINPFDQWGVELGKTLTSDLQAVLEDGSLEALDASTAGLIRRYRALQQSGAGGI